MVRQWILSGVLLVAALSAANAADKYADIHTVAIISTLGDQILVEKKADVINTDLSPSVTIDSKLGIDAYISKEIASAISSRFVIADADVDPSYLTDFPISPERLSELKERFSARPQSSVDAFIIVHPVKYDAPSMLRTVEIARTGIVLTHTKGLFGVSDTSLNIDYMVSVLDAKTGKKIDYGTAFTRTPEFFHPNPVPLLFCDTKKAWPQDPQHPDEAVLKQLDAEIMAVIATSLPVALNGANLTKSKIEPLPTSWAGIDLSCQAISG